MKKVHLVCLIIVGISNLYNVNCCKTLRSRRDQKAVSSLADNEKINAGSLPYDNAKTTDYVSHEVDNAKTLAALTSVITYNTYKKFKRDTPIFPPHSDELKETPRTLIATIGDYDDSPAALLNDQKTKRNPSDNDPLKPRRPRDKKFMCLCEETKCRNKDCLQTQAQSSQENNEEDENNAAEVLDIDVNVIDKSSNEPKKFNIPFANNVNFDQRVIVDGKNVQPKPPLSYPVYANPQTYHYTPYNLAHPGLIYTGIAPLQQNYAPTAAYNKFPSPSPIPAHLLKLWKNGAQNLIPVDNNPKPKPTPEYVPKYSSAENAKKENPAEPNKVTTPRQVDNKLYLHNYPPQGRNIEDLRPAYSYSTDFSYHNQPYTTEVVSADEFNFITESSTEMRHLPFGDPTTTNYAPSYYTSRQTPDKNYGNAISNEYSPSYATTLPNQYPSENPPVPINNFESLNAYPINNQNIPQYDYNGMPISTFPPAGYTNIPVIGNNGYPSQEDTYNPANDDGLNIEVDRVINEYRNNAPIMSVPNDSDLKVYNPPQIQAAQGPSQVIQPPASYNIENRKPSGQQQSNVVQPVITLQDVNNGYTSHYNPQRTATLRNANAYKPNGNVAASNTEPTSKSNENLFRGLEKIILNNGGVSDVPQMQAVDERPSTTYENTYQNPDNTIIQNAVKKVLNNFVPGKAEDLLANYDTRKSQELTIKNRERLSPDLTNTHVLKNLLNVPEVEEMIIDTTKNLINQVTGSPVSETMIKATLRNVVNEIPRPTTPPKNGLKLNIRMTKRVPRYDENREVIEKIKSIIEKSELGDEAATHPLAQNVIVKTVKHSIDKEKGVADEAAIRRTFNQLVKNRKSTDNYNSGRPLIVQPKESYNKEPVQDVTYTKEDTGYKFVPVVSVNERRLQGGVWIESPKNLVGNKGQAKYLDEKSRNELIKQLEWLQNYNKLNSTNNYADDEKTGSPYDTTSQSVERKSDITTRKAVSKYYDIMDATVNPKIIPLHPSGNGYNVYQTNPIVTTLNYQNYRDPSYTTQQSNNNRLNLLIAPTTPKPYKNQMNLLVDSTPSDKGSVEMTNEPAYMGKLVPVTSITGSSDDSNLVWVGDGMKLPLTMRRMSDGSYALTLADEICKMFANTKCPCCLPAGRQGVIERERRNDEKDYSDDAEKLLSKKMSGNYRVRRESSEVTTTTISNVHSSKKISNALGKYNDFNDEDYEESEENYSIGNRGGPYKYQRYASLDKLISGSTRALGNMIRLVKDVVTEAHQKIHRRRRNSPKPPVSLL